MERLLITGASGCIGQAAVAWLRDEGIGEIIGFTRSGEADGIECVAGDETSLKVAGSMFDFSLAVSAFQADFVKAYGQDAWKKFQSKDSADAPKGGNATLNVMPEDMKQQIESAEIKTDGDKATLLAKGEDDPLPLVKQGDEWKVDGSALTQRGGPDQAAKLAETMQKMAAMVTKYRKAIGAEGIKAEDIDYQMGRDMMKAMSGMTLPGEERFNIDDL